MERMYAYTDESGAFGWALGKGSSSHFVISAILVKESQRQELTVKLEDIRKRYFGQGEMKSSKIGKDAKKRRKLLGELVDLPFNVFALVFDKKLMIDYKGPQYKQTFYKFLNNIVHKELRHAFSDLIVVADQIGGSDYMQSFSEYFKNNSAQPDLFGNACFMFCKSDNSLCIQLADIIAGSIARKYDELYVNEEDRDFTPIFIKKCIRIQPYPLTWDTYKIEKSPLAKEYDKDVAMICFKQSVDFINQHKDDSSIERQSQIITLKYLLFRFMNNDLRKYISTKELKRQLVSTDMKELSTHEFRNKIIAKMRDEGVILASSPTGYKIPSKISELYDFVNHGTSIIAPMLSRLKKCYDLIKLGTDNELDLLEQIQDKHLKKLIKEYNS